MFLYCYSLLDCLELLDGLGNEVDITDPDGLAFDVASAIFVSSVPAFLGVAMQLILGISARAVDAASLVQSMWQHLAATFPAACVFRAFL